MLVLFKRAVSGIRSVAACGAPLALAALLAGCGGGSASSTAVPVPAATTATSAPALGASGPTLTSSTDWVTAGHDLQRTSVQSAAGGLSAANVGQLHLVWTHQSTAAYDTAGPIVSNGVVYAVDTAGNVVALAASTGTVLWQRGLGAFTKMTPALLEGHLIVATEVNATPKSYSDLYALDPATGGIQWHRSINGGMHGSPVAVFNKLYVPVAIGDPGYCHPGGVYVFNEQTGAPGFEWLTDPSATSGGGAVWASLTYDGQRILFGSGNTCVDSPKTANAIVSITTAGSLLWSDQTANPLTDDDVGGSVLAQGGMGYVTGKTGVTYAVDTSTGAIAWQRRLAADLLGAFSTPVLVDGVLVVSGGYVDDPGKPVTTKLDGSLYGLDPASGAAHWKITATVPFTAPVSVTAGLVFTMIDANLGVLNPATGATLWSTPVFGSSRTQPAIAGGMVYAADLSGRLYAFALPTPANAAARRAVENTLRSLPRYNVVPYAPRLPEYCRLR